jgi:hypothetical protein
MSVGEATSAEQAMIANVSFVRMDQILSKME